MGLQQRQRKRTNAVVTLAHESTWSPRSSWRLAAVQGSRPRHSCALLRMGSVAKRRQLVWRSCGSDVQLRFSSATPRWCWPPTAGPSCASRPYGQHHTHPLQQQLQAPAAPAASGARTNDARPCLGAFGAAFGTTLGACVGLLGVAECGLHGARGRRLQALCLLPHCRLLQWRRVPVLPPVRLGGEEAAQEGQDSSQAGGRQGAATGRLLGLSRALRVRIGDQVSTSVCS
mmetsp:Transcript_26750/g.88933  ORF Transcript_26750/g.88933 Transcript_26750/m.88933 type:complete len:230 (-) Transcript_26750:20-709(-)